ncbi:MAG: hypothetical protein ACOCT0_03845, partial [Halobacteriota archaeon]
RDQVERMFKGMIADLKTEGVEGDAGNLVTYVQDNLRGHRVRVPREMVLMFRMVSTLEGVCKQMDESFNFTYEAYVYVLRERSDAVAMAYERMPEFIRDRVDAETMVALKRRAEEFAGYVDELAEAFSDAGESRS